jgi:hypothetical protein
MKLTPYRKMRSLLLFTSLSVCTLTAVNAADTYSLTWFATSVRGGISSGGIYSVSAMVTPPISGAVAGSAFRIEAGLTGLLGFQSDDNARSLLITIDAQGNVQISWPPVIPGLVLQESDSLLNARWSNSPNGTRSPAIIPAGEKARFFRLSKP